MNFPEAGLYHVYNRGNNSQTVFYCDEDYWHFMGLCKRYLTTRSQVLAWCLIPNHFHFLLEINPLGLERIVWGGNEMPSITNGFQLLQSNYAKRINSKQNRTGSLFQQKTNSKYLETLDDALKAFWYIHQNPVEARLTMKMSEWQYSSYPDYCGIRNNPFCNVELGKEIFGLSEEDFVREDLADRREGNLGRNF